MFSLKLLLLYVSVSVNTTNDKIKIKWIFLLLYMNSRDTFADKKNSAQYSQAQEKEKQNFLKTCSVDVFGADTAQNNYKSLITNFGIENNKDYKK